MPPIIGLSLCIQGTRRFSYDRNWCGRFIPVHTGNAVVPINRLTTEAVYPCAYRERLNRIIWLAAICGLSLCVQGTLYSYPEFEKIFRFIPVCTGNAPTQMYKFIQSAGLSLCVQGTLDSLSYNRCPWRFIPVCTGNAPIITYCFIFKILTVKFLPIF